MAQAVIGQADDLARRIELPRGQGLFGGRIGPAAILVEVIAGMDDQVEFVRRSGMGIGVEITEADIRAGEHRHPPARGRSLRQGARAPDRGRTAVRRDEAIIIPPIGREPCDHGLGAPIALR